ncbi:hypothetical protein [Nocardiopsis sp. NPDC055824]
MSQYSTDEALSSGRPAKRRRFSDEMLFTSECVSCEADLRTTDPQEQVVIGRNGGQLAACRGECARRACGHPGGLPGRGPVPPLERRIAKWEDFDQ